VEFMPGAFAYHLHSFSALTLRSTDRHWAGPLLARGVTATMGCVDEPYLQLMPDMAVFFDEFLNLGFSYGEAAYGCQRFLSWQTAVIGDPLYRPFGRKQLQEQYLEKHHSKLLEWAQLRDVNLRLVQGAPPAEAIAWLEKTPMTHQSAVLTEKLAELYSEAGKPEDSVKALQQVLKLGPTPQQRVRVTLTLGVQLMALGRNQEAYELYRQFLKLSPDYPDQLNIDRHLRDLAGKLGHREEADGFEREISRLVPAPN
jgi:tetratricopeptide (TPR) repeat protein